MSDVGTWSTNAVDNNRPSPNGWPENMPPSGVNDSARENMAAIKRMTLDLPYISLGGAITYVDSTTFTIADDALNTNYAKYYPAGRQVKVKYLLDGAEAVAVGAVANSDYANGVSTIALLLAADAPLPTTVSDVLVGLQVGDVTGLAGPNMLGVILPFTADIDKVPFGFGLADGEPFDPEIYQGLAQLYYIKDDESGNPVYKYGQVETNGRWWPKKPDVRGYFPRFLDPRPAPTGGKEDTRVDQGAPRATGSIQEGQVGSHGHTMRTSNQLGDNSAGTGYVAGFVYASGASRNMWQWSSNVNNTNAIPKIGNDETRPVNIALPGLLVMFGGYASATQVTPESLINKVLVNIQPAITAMQNEVNTALSQLSTDTQEAFAEIDTRLTAAEATIQTSLDTAVGEVTAAGDAFVSQASDYATAAKASADRAEDLVSSLGTVVRYKGSVATYADLPTEGNEVGDTYNVADTGANYAWTGTTWDKYSETVAPASETTVGIVQLATTDEAFAATSTTKSVTPAGLSRYKTYISDTASRLDDDVAALQAMVDTKQRKAFREAVVVPTSAWVTTDTGTSATVSVSGLTTNDLVFVGPAPTDEDIAAWAGNGVYAKAQGEGTLTLACSSAPTTAMVINIGVLPYDN